MKNNLKMGVILTALSFSTAAMADFDGNYLYKGYKDYDRENNSQDAFAYMGYVRGVTVMLIADKKICTDDNFQFTQAFDTVGNYFKLHPKSRTLVPVVAVAFALESEFPCAKSDKS